MNPLMLIAFLATVLNQVNEPKPVATVSMSQLFDAAGFPGGLEDEKQYKITEVMVLDRKDDGSLVLTSDPVPPSVVERSVRGMIGSSFPDEKLACLLPGRPVTIYATVVREVLHGIYHLQITKAECDKQEKAVPIKGIALSTIAGATAIGLGHFLEAKKRPDGTLEPPPTTSTPTAIP